MNIADKTVKVKKQAATFEEFLSTPKENLGLMQYPDFPIGAKLKLKDGISGILKNIRGSGGSALFEIIRDVEKDKGLLIVNASSIVEIDDEHCQEEVQKLKALLG